MRSSTNLSFRRSFSNRTRSVRRTLRASIGIDRESLQDDLNRNQAYLALNTGTAVGRIHIIDKLDDTVEIGDNEIVVLKELPLTLPPVRGVIVATALVAALAHQHSRQGLEHSERLYQGRRQAVSRLQHVRLSTRGRADGLQIRAERRLTTSRRSSSRRTNKCRPPISRSTKLTGLREMRKTDSDRLRLESPRISARCFTPGGRHHRARRLYGTVLLVRQVHEGQRPRQR